MYILITYNRSNQSEEGLVMLSDTRERDAKDTKIQVRLHSHQKATISRAAEIKQSNLTAFMVETAYTAAQAIIAEHLHFSLNEEEWAAFCDILDAQPVVKPELRKLLTEPSAFDHGE